MSRARRRTRNEPSEQPEPSRFATPLAEPQSNTSDTNSSGSFGGWLRRQREARGVEIAEIAATSKISTRYLQALEQDRFEILPAPIFVRGFLREYARVVGLDPDEVVNLFLVQASERRPERRNEPPLGTRAQSASASAPSSRAVQFAVAILILLGALVALTFWIVGARAESTVAVRTTAEATPAPTPLVREPGVDSRGPFPAGEPATAVPADSPPAATALRLLLEFQDDCWAEVVIDGERRTSELRAGGETLALEANESVVLTLGNAPAVRAELNGRPLSLPVDGSRLLRDFRIDRSSLPPDVEAAPPGAP